MSTKLERYLDVFNHTLSDFHFALDRASTPVNLDTVAELTLDKLRAKCHAVRARPHEQTQDAGDSPPLEQRLGPIQNGE